MTKRKDVCNIKWYNVTLKKNLLKRLNMILLSFLKIMHSIK